ncbi:hypothetical protein M422DRAFT_785572, partial [Sphaerobolus stellatus SS14]
MPLNNGIPVFRLKTVVLANPVKLHLSKKTGSYFTLGDLDSAMLGRFDVRTSTCNKHVNKKYHDDLLRNRSLNAFNLLISHHLQCFFLLVPSALPVTKSVMNSLRGAVNLAPLRHLRLTMLRWQSCQCRGLASRREAILGAVTINCETNTKIYGVTC